MRKLSSGSNQSSTFALFGGSKMSLQKLSERQHDFTKFPMTRFYVTKKSQKFKFSKFARELALTPRGMNAKICTITDTDGTLGSAKNVIFYEKCS